MAQPHRVIVLGGGFGGLSAVRRLKRAPVEVILIDRRNFHLFQPLMYQIATGSLSPGEIAAPLRGVLSRQKNTQVLLGEVSDIDPAAKKIQLLDGASFDYDSLIVATGSQTSYYGNDAWREWAPSLKSVEEATAIRHKILYAFERAERAATHEESRAWLTFVIVGAGATGMELAGALAEIANETLKNDFRHINPQEARILLVEGGSRVLPSFPEDLSAKAEKLVSKLGVEVMKGVMVTNIDAQGVTFRRGDKTESLAAHTVLWAGGVETTTFGRKLAQRTHAETDKSGRIKVNSDLTIPNYPDIFIVGDLGPCSRKRRQAPARRRPGCHPGRSLRRQNHQVAHRKQKSRSRIPLFQQRRYGRNRPRRRSRQHFWFSSFRIHSLVHLALRPSHVHRGISKPRNGFHSVGI